MSAPRPEHRRLQPLHVTPQISLAQRGPEPERPVHGLVWRTIVQVATSDASEVVCATDLQEYTTAPADRRTDMSVAEHLMQYVVGSNDEP